MLNACHKPITGGTLDKSELGMSYSFYFKIILHFFCYFTTIIMFILSDTNDIKCFSLVTRLVIGQWH